MAFAIFGSLNGTIWTGPRLYYAMAQENHWFKVFGKLDPKTKVPYVGFIAEAILTVLFICFNSLQDLTILVAFASLIFNSMTVLAVPILRKKLPNTPRPYKVWLPFVYIYLAAEIILIIYTLMTDTRNSLIAIAAQVIGLAIYAAFEFRNRRQAN